MVSVAVIFEPAASERKSVRVPENVVPLVIVIRPR